MKKNFLSLTNLIALWLIVAASFSINLPVAFGSISLGLLLIIWIISGNYGQKFTLILSNPGAQIALAFLGLYALGTVYSSASWHVSLHYFLKYAKLLIIPLVIGMSISQKYQKFAINAFLISMIGYLIISYLNWLGLFSFGVMRHGTYMALGAYLMLRNAKRMEGLYRLVWATLSGLTMINILFIADVRTGIVTLSVLFVMFAFETWRFKGLIYVAMMALLALFAYKNIHDTHNLRIVGIQKEISADPSASSAGQRLEMYRHTLILIGHHPLFGGGTGSIEGEYTNLIKDDPSVFVRKVTNPHNQFLMTMQELGLIGLLILIAFWGVHWWQSYRLDSTEAGYLLRALIITTALGSAFNSLLLDSGDGRMYCILSGILLAGYQSKRGHKFD